MTPELRLDRPAGVVNLGLDIFARELETQDVPVVQVEWRPPAGPADIATLLASLDE